MAYNTLKKDIATAIKANGTGDITGDRLQQVLLSLVNTMGLGYQFVGVATPTTTPPSSDTQIPRFWLASGPGAYTHFRGLIITSDIAVITWTPATSGGKYEWAAVYNAPAALPVLELYDTTNWEGGFSGGVKEYIETYHPADGATFGVKISRTDNAADYYDGIATYSEAKDGIAIVANRQPGDAFNVWISAGDEEAVYYTLAGGTPDYRSYFLSSSPISVPWTPDTVTAIGYDGRIVVGRTGVVYARAIDEYERYIEGLPSESLKERYVYGDIEVNSTGDEIASASCLICNVYEMTRYIYAIEV